MKTFIPDILASSLQSLFRGLIVPAPSPSTIDRVAAAVSFNNTTTKMAVYSKTIGGNTVGLDQSLRLRLFGDMLANNGVGLNVRVTIEYGGTTLFDDNWTTAFGAARQPWEMDIIIANINAANVQKMMAYAIFGNNNAGSAPVAGEGRIAGSYAVGMVRGTAAVDTTADQLLQVTMKMGAANALNEIVCDYAMLEIL